MSQPYPVPSNPLPWRIANNRPNTLVDLSGESVGLLKGDSAEFVAFMSRFGPRAIEIVQRLAEWWEDKEHPIGSLGIEATRLWAEIQRDAKGGGGDE